MRTIDADAVADRVRRLKSQIATRAAGFVDEDSYECGAVDALHDALTYLDEAPTVDAVPVKHGKWFDAMVGEMPVQVCDQCRTFFPLAYTGGGHHYCPNCGARMDGEADE